MEKIDIIYNVNTLGQVFTPINVVNEMINLSKNIIKLSNQKIRLLEPSCGDGVFIRCLPKHDNLDVIGIEIDKKVCPEFALNEDFFAYPIDEKFDVIIGNPPYVKFNLINKDTKVNLKKYILDNKVFNKKINLYLYFIEKSIQHLKPGGELIFIVPREFTKASLAKSLNNFLYEQGTITDWIDLGDKKIFDGFSPNCAIFRFEKNNNTKETLINNKKHKFLNLNGQLFFTNKSYTLPLSDLFDVKVGGASGADNLFESKYGNKEFVFSKTKKTNETKRMFYNVEDKKLLPFKEQLLKRKIKKFKENNWYKWGRVYYESELPRIYVNIRTRQMNPFFLHSCNAYDGNIIALFPKINKIKNFNEHTMKSLCEDLNKIDWSELGFLCDNRYIFTQSSLENSYLPLIFEKYLV